MQLSGSLDVGSAARKAQPSGRDGGACGQNAGEGRAGGEFAKLLNGRDGRGERNEARRTEAPRNSEASGSEQASARETSSEGLGPAVAAVGETRPSAPVRLPEAGLEAAISGGMAQDGAGRKTGAAPVGGHAALGPQGQTIPDSIDRATLSTLGLGRGDARTGAVQGTGDGPRAAGGARQAGPGLAPPDAGRAELLPADDGVRPSILSFGAGEPSDRQSAGLPPAGQAPRAATGSRTSGASAYKDEALRAQDRSGSDAGRSPKGAAAQAGAFHPAVPGLPAGGAPYPSRLVDGRKEVPGKVGAEVPAASVPEAMRRGHPPFPNALQVPFRPGPVPGGGDGARLVRGDAPAATAAASGEVSGGAFIGSPGITLVNSAPTQMPAAAHGPAASGSARAVASQIAGAIAGETAPGRFELRLDPPELGRLEISLEIVEKSLRATVSAERSGTQDLVRRHADLLLAQLQQAGFSGVDLRFGAGEQRGFGGAHVEAAAMTPDPDAIPGDDAATGASGPVSRSYAPERLDLRF